MSGRGRARISDIRLDAASIVRWSREVEHERQVAVFDLLEGNSFELVDGFAGPYRVELSLREANLVFTVDDEAGAGAEHVVKVQVFMTDITERPKINPRRIAYFGHNLPASTLVEVKGLVDPRMKVEIECQAYVE